jgi:hypothetical protein
MDEPVVLALGKYDISYILERQLAHLYLLSHCFFSSQRRMSIVDKTSILCIYTHHAITKL